MSQIFNNDPLRAFFRVFDDIEDWAFAKDHRLRYMYANHAYLDACGWELYDIIGKTDEELCDKRFHLEALPKSWVREGELDVVLEGGTINLESESFMLPSGEKKICESRKMPLPNERGILCLCKPLARDVVSSEFMELEDVSGAFVSRHDPASLEFVKISPACEHLYGGTFSSLKNSSLLDYVHADHRLRFEQTLHEQVLEGQSATIFYQLVKPSGEILWVESLFEPMFKPNESSPFELICITKDITDMKESEEEMVQIQQQIIDTLESLDSGVVMFDEARSYVLSNQQFRVLFPTSGDVFGDSSTYDDFLELLCKHGAHEGSGLSRDEWRENVAHIHIDKDEAVQFSLGDRWIQLTNSRTYGGGVVTQLTDVSAIKFVEKELQRQKIMLDALLDSIPDLLFYKDLDGNYMGCNPAYCEYLGLSREELLGKNDFDLFPGHLARFFDRNEKKMLERGTARREEDWVLLNDGRRALLETLKSPYYDSDNNIVGIIGLSRDITRRHEAEVALVNRDRYFAGLADSVKELLGGFDTFDESLADALAAIGFAADVDRAFLIECQGGEKEDLNCLLRAKWLNPDSAYDVEPGMLDFNDDVFRLGWISDLAQDRYVAGAIDSFSVEIQDVLNQAHIVSLVLVPIFVSDHFWGILYFDTITAFNEWGDTECSVLRTVASAFGMALERKQAYDQLNTTLERANQLADEANEANRAKSDFLANMSHEIRTPLNGIVGFTSLLKKSKIDKKQEHAVFQIERSSEILLALINDLLDLSKITAGQFELDESPFAPTECINLVFETLDARFKEKHLSSEVSFGANPDKLFLGDGRRLNQIIFNLIGNSLKFTEKGRISLFYDCAFYGEREGAYYWKLTFEVRDTGMGIAADKLEDLFEPFVQADRSITRRFGGTGLGLSICRHLSRMMGGDISVESELGKGSSFKFHILCEAVEESVSEQKRDEGESDSNTKEELRSLNVLVADDNLINQDVLCLYLEDLGHQVEVANNGIEALNAYREHPFDFIFMDVRMPEMDGIEATKKIREYEQEMDIESPVVISALTADAIKSDMDLCLAAGMNDYITKPIQPDQIEVVLNRHC